MSEPAPIRLLIVDDHKVVREGLRSFLGTEPGIKIVGEAADGRQALDRVLALGAEGLRPDVVLMDLEMQPVDGIEATREIRSRWPDVEVVALTSFVEEDRVNAALEAGAAGYLLKDADADELVRAVRAAHHGELTLDPALARRLMNSLRARQDPSPADELTPREREILALVARGSSNQEIATQLVISERTARTHVSNILRKLNLRSRTQAALWAGKHGFAPPDSASTDP